MLGRQLTAGPGRVAHIRFTDRHDGDFSVQQPRAALARAQRTIADHPWTWLQQVHGPTVLVVDEPGAGAGAAADGSVSAVTGAVLAVRTADCAPVVLVNDGAIGVVHAGWRGVVAGIVPATVAALRRVGPGDVRALIGPLIRPGRYEFRDPELTDVVAAAGEAARATTIDGRPALDLAAAVISALKGSGVDLIEDLGLDTATPRYFSARCRGETQRQASAVWLEPA